MKEKRLQQHNPPHPGGILKRMYIEPLGYTISDFADKIGVRRATLSALINGKSAISVEMAIRLSIALETTPELWAGLQVSYDLWHAQKEARKNKSIAKIKALTA